MPPWRSTKLEHVEIRVSERYPQPHWLAREPRQVTSAPPLDQAIDFIAGVDQVAVFQPITVNRFSPLVEQLAAQEAGGGRVHVQHQFAPRELQRGG